jgi:hypothetical protein
MSVFISAFKILLTALQPSSPIQLSWLTRFVFQITRADPRLPCHRSLMLSGAFRKPLGTRPSLRHRRGSLYRRKQEQGPSKMSTCTYSGLAVLQILRKHIGNMQQSCWTMGIFSTMGVWMRMYVFRMLGSFC